MKFKNAVQYMTQVSFLAVTLFLMKQGKSPILLSIMLILSLLSVVYGRLFCGFLCPIHTVERLGIFIRRTLRLPEIQKMPELNKWMLYPFAVMLLGLLIVQALTPVLKIKIGFPILIVGFIIVVLVPGALWHRYLCPFALLMKMPSFIRPCLPEVDTKECKACAKCLKTCPTDALRQQDDKKVVLVKDRCIMCYRCESSCKFNVIK